MERNYDVLETFVEEQEGAPRRGDETTNFLLRSREFPKFSRGGGVSNERFLVFTFPFKIYLEDGDKIEFEDAKIDCNKKIIPVRLVDYSEFGVYLQDDKEKPCFKQVLRMKRREVDLWNYVLGSYTFALGEQRTPRLVVERKEFKLD